MILEILSQTAMPSLPHVKTLSKTFVFCCLKLLILLVQQENLHVMILAIHLLVGQTLSVQMEYAHVYLNTKVTLILAVDLNVS